MQDMKCLYRRRIILGILCHGDVFAARREAVRHFERSQSRNRSVTAKSGSFQTNVSTTAYSTQEGSSRMSRFAFERIRPHKSVVVDESDKEFLDTSDVREDHSSRTESLGEVSSENQEVSLKLYSITTTI